MQPVVVMARSLAAIAVLTLGALGVGSIAYGVWLGGGDGAADAALGGSTPLAGAALDAVGAVSQPIVTRAGSGTFDAAAPADLQAAETGARCPGCDVIVITMCSLRRDHVGGYSPGSSLTPALDALVSGGFRMDQAWAASNFTLAGLTAVLTGRFGSSTGVTGWDKGLVADVPTLPEVLGYYGYRTGAFTIDAPSGFRPDYGLDRGFQHMDIIPPPRDTPDGRSKGGVVGPGGASAAPAAAWIAAADPALPLFAMFHTRTAHFPFVLEDEPTDETGVTSLLFGAGSVRKAGVAMPGTAGGTAQRGVVEIAGKDPVQAGVRAAGAPGVAVWKRHYAEAVRRMDLDLAAIAVALATRGRLDQTIVVVLADHGESLDDHGELLHGDAYYDGVVHIPLAMKVPGMAGRPIPGLVSQVDLLPTILDLVGAVTPAAIDGASMLPLFDGTADSIRTTTLVEGGVSWHNDGFPRGAVVAPPWALIRQDRGCDGGDPPRKPGEPATCLYDLGADPGQLRNIATQHADVVTDLQTRWDRFRAARSDAAAATRLKLDPAYIEELHRNGYNFQPEGK